MNSFSDLVLKAHFDELRTQLSSENEPDHEFLTEVREFIESINNELSGDNIVKAKELIDKIDTKLQGQAAALTSKPMRKAGKRKKTSQKRQSI